jgi:hypothetical protein
MAASVTGSQSSLAEEVRGAMAAALRNRNAKAVTQTNRWVRFMVIHAPKLYRENREAGLRGCVEPRAWVPSSQAVT